jgi:LmbE family N-acetylglucosaminyl deacetylase
MNISDKPLFTPIKPSIVLGIAAHPDDLDFGASGAMAKFAQDGAEVHYLILTDGSKGSADTAMTEEKLTEMRRKEQRDAVAHFGGAGVEFLDYPDGQLEVTMELKKDIIKAIRTIRPDVVVTMDPTLVYSSARGMINHPDHRAAGQATLDAIYPLARDHMSFPELYEQGFKPHKVATVLLINFDNHNFAVNITDTIDFKMKALEAHVSQMPELEKTQAWMRDLASKAGAKNGYTYGEAFMRVDIR